MQKRRKKPATTTTTAMMMTMRNLKFKYNFTWSRHDLKSASLLTSNDAKLPPDNRLVRVKPSSFFLILCWNQWPIVYVAISSHSRGCWWVNCELFTPLQTACYIGSSVGALSELFELVTCCFDSLTSSSTAADGFVSSLWGKVHEWARQRQKTTQHTALWLYYESPSMTAQKKKTNKKIFAMKKSFELLIVVIKYHTEQREKLKQNYFHCISSSRFISSSSMVCFCIQTRHFTCPRTRWSKTTGKKC